MTFVLDYGGRSRRSTSARDCVARAIAIATGKPYGEVWYDLHGWMRADALSGFHGDGEVGTPDNGVPRSVYEPYLKSLGWKWIPVMGIGTGCKMHLRPDELPKGRIIARCSRHLVACVDGIPHDIFDPSRGGTRCVYGYFIYDRAA